MFILNAFSQEGMVGEWSLQDHLKHMQVTFMHIHILVVEVTLHRLSAPSVALTID